MEKNRIEISVRHKKTLETEFNTSKTTVQQALDYYNNSEMAQSIRNRAKEMLLEEASKIKV